MASIRVIQAILGYIFPFVLLFTGLFFLEWFIEVMLGMFAVVMNNAAGTALNETPDFIGPTDLINTAIGYFPSIWDIGTVFFYGSMAQVAYAFYIVFAVISGLVALSLLKQTKDAFLAIANDATGRAGMILPAGTIRPPPPPSGASSNVDLDKLAALEAEGGVDLGLGDNQDLLGKIYDPATKKWVDP